MKSKRTKILILSLMMALVFLLANLPFALGEDSAEPAATQELTAADEVTAETDEAAIEDDYSLDVWDTIKGIAASTGFVSGDWRQYVMLGIACVLLYLAIVKKFEPLLLLPIGFGMLLANLPSAGLMDHETFKYFASMEDAVSYAQKMGKDLSSVVYAYSQELGEMAYRVPYQNAGLLYYLYQGVKLGIYPPLIFMGVGAMTDFAPLIANPKSLLLGAAAQLGIFLAFTVAILLGFTKPQAASIGIIGGADGPTAIYLTTKLAPELLGAIAVAAYSYMALVPVIQPPIMKALTTKRERQIVMKQLRPVTKAQTIIFPVVVTIVVSLLLPSAAPLVGMLMLGNLMKVSGVTERISKTAQNELMNIVTIFLGVTVGATTNGATFLTWDTIKIVIIGVFAFSGGTAGGVLLAKLLNKVSGGNSINPLIGSAGVSAVPMAARVSQDVGRKENPGNFLLMHAMGPNVAGVIGSAVAAGVFLSMFG